MVNELPPLLASSTAMPLPLIAAVGLAVLGWLMAGPGRMLGVVAVLVAVGSGLGLAIYLANGLSVLAALAADPLGGALWFGWIGTQLAVPGIVACYVRLWTGEWGAA